MASVKWFKSSRSGNNGACVEVARLSADEIGVRDTKTHGQGPVLTFTAIEWNAFIAGAKSGEFDLAE